MKKRFAFLCWNCGRNYTLFREITNEQILTVACPFCDAEGVVDLEPHRKMKKHVLRGNGEPEPVAELELPDPVPTRQPE
jgi:transposase-like protein